MMSVKKFKGTSLPEILTRIRSEFGDNAVILKTEEINRKHPRFVSSNRVVVTAAGEPVKSAQLPSTLPSSKTTVEEFLASNLERSNDQVSNKATLSIRPSETIVTNIAEELCTRLLQQGIDGKILERMLEICLRHLDAGALQNRIVFVKFLTYLFLRTLTRYDGSAPTDCSQPICFLGRSGAGKSTTIAKLAVTFLRQGRDVVVIAPRGGRKQLLDLLSERRGLTYLEAYDGTEVGRFVDFYRDTHVVLIDTPSITTELALVQRFLPSDPSIERHLVLKADAQEHNLYATLEAFEQLGFRKLVFTNLDQTGQFGTLLNTMYIADRPISFLSEGTSSHGTIHPYSKEKLVALLRIE